MKKLLIFTSLIFVTGCMVGPKYHRPSVSVPKAFRGQSPPKVPAAKAESLGNQKWWQVFKDPVLDKLIRTAIAQNYDLRIAAARVMQAQAMLGITRGNQFPFVSAGAGLFSEKNPKVSKVFPSYEANAGNLNLSVIWDLDFWGKYRQETQAARAGLLASEWGQRAVLSSLVASVASAYFQLRALDSQLVIAQDTLASRRDSLRLIQVLRKHGSESMLDVSQAEQLVDTAAETIPDLQRQIEQQENAIRLLLGENPGPVPRGLPLIKQPAPPTVPAGLTSQLLERRPDILEAEDNLIAANANIGVAKADLFPSISLTGTGGYESYALNRFISNPSQLWNATVNVSQPVFSAGALRAGVRLTRAEWQQMVLTYQQTVLDAFEQVSNALIGYRKDRDFTREQRLLTQAAKQSDQLSIVLYHNGGASYLQVLTSETNYFAAELNLVQAELNERLSLVQIYQTLGGGWQQ